MANFGTSRSWQLTGTLLPLFAVMMFVPVGTQESPPHHCPHGGASYDGRCYWVSETKATWTHANTLCHRLYGDNVTLATIKDEGTNRFIEGLTNRAVWIGLHESHGEGELRLWRWVDNTPINSDSEEHYSNWNKPLYPSGNGRKNCAVMYKSGGQWRDVDCKKEYKFVCNQLSSRHICSKGGIFFRDRCYWPVNDGIPFSDANSYCREHFGDETRIAVAKDHRTNLFLSRLIYPGVWLGLHDKGEEGDWRWVDNSPLRYSNWRQGEPNNVNHEDCAVLTYGDALWNDQPCGRGDDEGLFLSGALSISSYDASQILNQQPIVNGNRFVCAVPTCYDAASDLEDDEDMSYDSRVGSGSTPDPDPAITDALTTDTPSTGSSSVVCLSEECSATCVEGSVCDVTGACLCTKEFPEMVCDTSLFEMYVSPPVLNATLGGSFTLKCQTNLPVNHFFRDLVWIPLADNRTTVTHFMHRGSSLLEVTDVQLSDATVYTCRAVYLTKAGTRWVTLAESTAVVRIDAPESSNQTTDVPHVTTGAAASTPERDHVSDDVTAAPPIPTTIPPPVTTRTTTGVVVTNAPPRPTTSPSFVTTVTRRGLTTPSVTATEKINTNTTIVQTDRAKTTVPEAKTTASDDKKSDSPKDTEVKDETGNKVDPGPPNDSQKSPNPRDGRATVAIVPLSVFVVVVLVVVVGLLLKMRMKRNTFAMSRLIELNERN